MTMWSSCLLMAALPIQAKKPIISKQESPETEIVDNCNRGLKNAMNTEKVDDRLIYASWEWRKYDVERKSSGHSIAWPHHCFILTCHGESMVGNTWIQKKRTKIRQVHFLIMKLLNVNTSKHLPVSCSCQFSRKRITANNIVTVFWIWMRLSHFVDDACWEWRTNVPTQSTMYK